MAAIVLLLSTYGCFVFSPERSVGGIFNAGAVECVKSNWFDLDWPFQG